MGKPGGFLEYDRVDPPHRTVEERTHDYLEVITPLPAEELRRQAARCMDCGVPYCHLLGCPLNNVIPNWNHLVYRGMWREAYEQLEETNNFPEITGRVCPSPCEAACTLAVNTSPVTVNHIERSIIEYAFEQRWVVPHIPAVETGRRAAVIGSGPSGLAAAQQLRRLGHTVVLFEKRDKVGGILRYGIPDFKLDKYILDRRIGQMMKEGVAFKTNVDVGADVSVEELRNSFDVILIAIGAGHPRDLEVPGRELGGIHPAMEYLVQSNSYVAGLMKKEEVIWAENKNVLVIGGGDTGSDCVGTAVRQGARKVYQIEILPKPRDWDKPFNPDWPDWPKVLRSSSSHEEGCERKWSVATKQFEGDSGSVAKAHLMRVDWKEIPGTKQLRMTEIPGSEYSLNVNLVLLAMGFLHVEHNNLVMGLGVAFDERGNIKTDGRYATSVPGVFTAGDAMTGASLVARALWHGREAAVACHEYLQQVKHKPRKSVAQNSSW